MAMTTPAPTTAPVILVVDNDPRIAKIMHDYLEPKGYVVKTCGDPSEIAASIRETSPKLVLLDVLMPGIGGVETCRQIRAGGFKMPVVMLSSQGTRKDMDRARAAGADDYFTKPVDLKILEATLWKLLNGRPK
jgi:DNA-binding response OmpR family regulator